MQNLLEVHFRLKSSAMTILNYIKKIFFLILPHLKRKCIAEVLELQRMSNSSSSVYK